MQLIRSFYKGVYMGKMFNVNADCQPSQHYMVDISGRLQAIKEMVDAGQYFTINRARQFGKTTTLKALGELLKKDYVVVNLDFQMISYADFESERNFVSAFSRELLDTIDELQYISEDISKPLESFAKGCDKNVTLSVLFKCLSRWCGESEKKLVLIIDEVDSATNNQVFLDFLAQLRGYYIRRDRKPTFQSVILAGVYDVKNLKRKIVDDSEHKVNSPWNIAADFLVDMSFSVKDIAGMLTEYEDDCETGMDIMEMAGLIYEYTSGYPFLISRICKLIDEWVVGLDGFPTKHAAWSKAGVLEAVRFLLSEKNTLFESLTGKLVDFPELKNVLYSLLFHGQSIVYNPDDEAIDIALMFGFVKIEKGSVVIANRIFETRLYNFFLAASEVQGSNIYRFAIQDKNQFIENGHLNMNLVLEKFVTHFNDVYGNKKQTFLEEDGRRYFLLYLRPIINGTGNYYIEAQTRDMRRTDVIVDYHGEQFVIELKLWRGNEYNVRGESQLSEYLDYYHLKKGYMLSFNFNDKKQIGVKEIMLGDKILVEAVV